MPPTGHIFQINASPGGVPKRPQPTATVHTLGLQNDQQRDTVHHGGPDRAVCLFPLEHILALQAEGYPIYPGAVGENITTNGLDWAPIVPGARLQLGDVLLEITSYAAPCSDMLPVFTDGNINRISAKKHPGWARAYARVLQPGDIKIGDPVVLIA